MIMITANIGNYAIIFPNIPLLFEMTDKDNSDEQNTLTVALLLERIRDRDEEIDFLNETISALESEIDFCKLNHMKEVQVSKKVDNRRSRLFRQTLSAQEQEEWDIQLHERNRPDSKKEVRHLQVQAVGLALSIWSGNKIGIADICRHPAMIEINEYYFDKSGNEKKLNTPKQLLKNILPQDSIAKGRKKKNYYKFEESWQPSSSIDEYYAVNKVLPRVFQIKNGKNYIDIQRIDVVISAWWKMVSKKYISINFFINSLCLMYFKECKYQLGYIFPDSVFGECLASLRDDYPDL